MKTNPFFDSVLYRDKEGNSITLHKWTDLIENNEYRVIKQDKVGPYLVSTVWLGITHLHGHFFETMIFYQLEDGKESNDAIDQFMQRYSSLSAAKLGHEVAVSMVRDLLKNS